MQPHSNIYANNASILREVEEEVTDTWWKRRKTATQSQNNGQDKEIVSSYTLPLLLSCSFAEKMLDLNFSSLSNIFPVG